jgi:hypothetical protein
LKAGDIVKEIAPIVCGAAAAGRNGAGRGKDPSKIDDAMARAIEIIKAHLRK